MAIPLQVKGILSKINLANEPIDSFPFNFIAYIKANLSRLSRMFEQMFDREELSEDSRLRIRDFAKVQERTKNLCAIGFFALQRVI